MQASDVSADVNFQTNSICLFSIHVGNYITILVHVPYIC